MYCFAFSSHTYLSMQINKHVHKNEVHLVSKMMGQFQKLGRKNKENVFLFNYFTAIRLIPKFSYTKLVRNAMVQLNIKL